MSDNLQVADSNDVQPIDVLGSTALLVEIKLPWQDTFGLGMGIDALTGESKVSPFEEVNWTPSPSERTGIKVTATSQVIRHCHELRHDFHVDAAVTVNPCSLAAVGTGLEYLRSWKVSSSATLVESKISGHYPFENPPKNEFKLSDEASKCLMENPDRFRDRYGDYFIYGIQSGFIFHTVFKNEDQKQTDAKSFGASAVASFKDVLGSQKSSGGVSNVENLDFIAEDYRLVHSGCDLGLLVGSPVDKNTSSSDLRPVKTLTLSEVGEMTRTLLTTPQPCVPQVALLKHYSFLYSELSNTVPVPKNAFSDVRELGELADVLEVDCRHEAITQVDRNVAESLVQRFRHERPSLVKNNTAREFIEEGLRAAANMMDSVIGRFCLETRLDEPGIQAQPKRGSDSSRRRYARWQFGINPDKVDPNDKYSDITIRLPQREVQVCQRFIKAKVVKKNSPAKLQFGCNSSRDMVAMENDVWVTGLAKIVGWTLSCDNDDDEKVSFKCKGGIKERNLEIAAEATVGREWHLRVTFMHMYD